MTERTRRITLEQARKLRSLSNAKKVKEMTEEEIDRIIAEDPDLYQLTDEELSEFSLARNPRNGTG
jgi:hypothetical protein